MGSPMPLAGDFSFGRSVPLQVLAKSSVLRLAYHQWRQVVYRGVYHAVVIQPLEEAGVVHGTMKDVEVLGVFYLVFKPRELVATSVLLKLSATLLLLLVNGALAVFGNDAHYALYATADNASTLTQ